MNLPICPESEFLVWDQPHSKFIDFSYLIRRELFQGIFGPLPIKCELALKLCIKLMTNSLQAHTKIDQQFQIKSDLNLMAISLQTHYKTPSKLKFCDLKFALSIQIQ
jgi:hypothetical protein